MPRAFYARPAVEVAPDLLGMILVRRLPNGEELAARIVEVEAYGPNDPASHAFRGRTVRNATMFGRPGHLYVYFSYGMHHCMNAVTDAVGEGSAVLLRAAEPVEGVEEMRRRRSRGDLRELCSGPAKLSQALGVDRTLDGADLVRGDDVWIREGMPTPRAAVVAGTRVGITVGLERPWRFRIAGDAFVSRKRPVSRPVSSGPPTP